MLFSKTTRALAVLAAAGLIPGPAALHSGFSQEPATPPNQPPVFSVQTAAVALDVVVRDKKGHLVRDLTPQDFEIYEDGVKQPLSSFRIVDKLPRTAAAPAVPAEPGATPPAAVEPALAEPNAETSAPSVIAFVFDRLQPEARKVASKAAVTYTERGHVEGDMVAVFSIDLALRTLQPFTNNLPAIRTALERAALQGNTQFASEREEARRRIDSGMAAADALSSIGTSGGTGMDAAQSQITGLLAVQQITDQMQSDMLRAFDVLERDQQGFATTNALMAVVNGLKAIPGRKTVIFFSEGVAIPATVQARFRDVIASANRANVSVYAIDAGGLRIESGSKEARDEIVQAARQRAAQQASGMESRSSLSRNMERTEDMLRLNPESGLGQLASETGGFLVHDTNDATQDFGRIQEEMRFYYMLSYAPTNDVYDGRFRTLNVKVRRPGVSVQTRKGYFAVRPEYAVPIRVFEAPAIAQLDRSPRPDAFPLHAAALSFPETDRPGLAPVMAELSGASVAWAPQRPSGFHSDFSVVVRIKDARGREADRLSQQYSLSAPADKLDAARAGKILFYQEADVPPGRYTAEVVAFDNLSQAASVRAVPFEVPAAKADGLRLSTLMLVNRAERLTPAEQKDSKNPLHFGEVILYPNMGAPLKKASNPSLGFYVTIYGTQVASAHTATIEVMQGTKVLARTAAALSAPDARGRIQHAGTLPLTALTPGAYALKFSVGDGAAAQTREAAFTVAD